MLIWKWKGCLGAVFLVATALALQGCRVESTVPGRQEALQLAAQGKDSELVGRFARHVWTSTSDIELLILSSVNRSFTCPTQPRVAALTGDQRHRRSASRGRCGSLGQAGQQRRRPNLAGSSVTENGRFGGNLGCSNWPTIPKIMSGSLGCLIVSVAVRKPRIQGMSA